MAGSTTIPEDPPPDYGLLDSLTGFYTRPHVLMGPQIELTVENGKVTEFFRSAYPRTINDQCQTCVSSLAPCETDLVPFQILSNALPKPIANLDQQDWQLFHDCLQSYTEGLGNSILAPGSTSSCALPAPDGKDPSKDFHKLAIVSRQTWDASHALRGIVYSEFDAGKEDLTERGICVTTTYLDELSGPPVLLTISWQDFSGEEFQAKTAGERFSVMKKKEVLNTVPLEVANEPF